MAQDIYTKITELEPISGYGLKSNDKFMISRPTGGENGYMSYRCDYGDLSSAFVSSIVNALSVNNINIETQNTVSDLEKLDPQRRRLVAENVIWYIYQMAQSSSSQSGALLKKSLDDQYVEGPVVFTGRLCCDNDVIAGGKDVVNYSMLSNYVATAGIMPFLKGCTADIEGESKTTIKPDSENDLYGITHAITQDCIAQIILHSKQAYNDFCIFMYCVTCHSPPFESIYAAAKADVESGNPKLGDYCVLQYQPLAANKPVTVNLPMRKDNILCFFPVGEYKDGDIKPKAGQKIKRNTLTITIREYRAFAE